MGTWNEALAPRTCARKATAPRGVAGLRTAVLLAAWAAAAPAMAVRAQELADSAAIVRGTVIDSVTGRPVLGAEVRLERAYVFAFTDSLGRFSLPAPALPEERLRIHGIGYADQFLPADSLPPGAPILLRLMPQPVVLRGLTAEARRNARYALEGAVTDSLSGLPVRGAVVRFRGAQEFALTDSLGRFALRRLHAGSAELTVDVVGYVAGTTSISIGEDARADVRLTPDPYVLPGLTAAVEAVHRARQLAYHALPVRIYTEADLAAERQPSVLSLLRRGGFANVLDDDGGVATTGFCRPAGVCMLPVVVVLDGDAWPAGQMPNYPMSDVYEVVVYGGGQVIVTTKTYLRALARERTLVLARGR